MDWIKNHKKIVIIILLILGVGFLAFGARPLYPQISWWLNSPDEENFLLDFAPEDVDWSDMATTTDATITTTTVGSRIIIPGIGVNMEIITDEDNEQRAFARGAWALPGTAEPGAITGNAVIAAHRYLYTSGPNTFYHLDKLKINDRILIRWAGENYTYRVKEIKVVTPSAVEILDQPTDRHILTIFTCHPVYTTKSRLVIVSELED